MNMFSIKSVVLGLALSATVMGANAQKTINEGVATYGAASQMFTGDEQAYFKADTASVGFQMGPAKVKMVANKSGDYVIVVLDVPVANIKKVAVGTPAEIDEGQANDPQYAFTKTDETKKIGDYNCKKYIAKDARDGTTYDLWITNDIIIPANMMTRFYSSLGGTPVLFTYLQYNSPKLPSVVTLKSVTETKVPADMFKIPADYDKITLTDLANMRKGRQ